MDRIIFVLAEIRACFSGKAIEGHGGSHLCISVGMGGAWLWIALIKVARFGVRSIPEGFGES